MALVGLRIVRFATVGIASVRGTVRLRLHKIRQTLAVTSHGDSMISRLIEENTRDYCYTVDASIGTPPKVARLILDTGSSDLWVDHLKVSGLEESATATDRRTNLDVAFAKGEVSGGIYTDVICLTGDTSTEPSSSSTSLLANLFSQVSSVLGWWTSSSAPQSVCVPRQPYVLAHKIEGVTNPALNIHGFLGMGVPSTFLSELTRESFASHLAVGLRLDFTSENSFMIVGDLEEVMTEAPIDSVQSAITMSLFKLRHASLIDAFWLRITMKITRKRNMLTYGEYSIGWLFQMSLSTGCNEYFEEESDLLVIPDSGSSFIIAPDKESYTYYSLRMLDATYQNRVVESTETFSAMVSKLSSGKCATRCENSEVVIICFCDFRLQPLTFVFHGDNGKELKIELGADDLFTIVSTSPNLCRMLFMDAPAHVQGPDAAWVLGIPFLHRAYLVHDYHELKLTVFPISANNASHAPGVLARRNTVR